MGRKKLVLVAGARPNFVKLASVTRALDRRRDLFEYYLVHTGQHYDDALSKVFFDELEIPRPHVNLKVGSGSHTRQTAEIMVRFEEVLGAERPEAIVVAGDVNSTIACAMVAAKAGVKVVHVEAGLRSYDRRMPEEINRVLTDSISDLLLVSERSGLENLRKEGISGEKVQFVGNVMIDTLLEHRAKADLSTVLSDLDLEPGGYSVLTLHRPSNVDSGETLEGILSSIDSIGRRMPVVFPVHPRTVKRVEELGLSERLSKTAGLRTAPPLGYLDFLKLQAEAKMVLTDSGGIQEETTILGVPCITIRENTERPVTITHGTNVLAGTSPRRILQEAEAVLNGQRRLPDQPPELWDGRAGDRIVEVFAKFLIRPVRKPLQGRSCSLL